MNYVLVHDDCETCRYTVAAFCLLRLPLTCLSLSEFNTDQLTDTQAVLLCPHIETQHHNQIIEITHSLDIGFISFHHPNTYKKNTKNNIYFLAKHFSHHELNDAIIQCLHYKNHIPTLTNYHYPIFEKLVGTSKQMCYLKKLISQVACSNSTVLILGQSGTGKDVIASCIHYLSDRKNNPMVPINCGAIPGELIESELFGHEKGAFTGALNKRQGRFELANSGTLFLDEIGDMPLPMQVKLLRVIQERKIERVGGINSIDVDIRLIAATNKNLEERINQNLFREDLFYRLNVFPIQAPTLAERSEDIPALIDYHLEKIQLRLKHRVIFNDTAKEILSQYAWPGNIRELQNFLERMIILHPDEVLNETHIDIKYKQTKKIGLGTSVSQTDLFSASDYLATI